MIEPVDMSICPDERIPDAIYVALSRVFSLSVSPDGEFLVTCRILSWARSVPATVDLSGDTDALAPNRELSGPDVFSFPSSRPGSPRVVFLSRR